MLKDIRDYFKVQVNLDAEGKDMEVEAYKTCKKIIKRQLGMKLKYEKMEGNKELSYTLWLTGTDIWLEILACIKHDCPHMINVVDLLNQYKPVFDCTGN